MIEHSNHTEILLTRLRSFSRNKLWFRNTIQKIKIVSTLHEIARRPEISVVPHLIIYLFDSSKDIRNAACFAITRAMQSLTIAEIACLPEDSFVFRGWWFPAEWVRLNEQHVATWLEQFDDSDSLLEVLSFHPNGFVREAVVKKIAENSGERALAFLLIRVNDWVEQVRRTACEGVSQYLAENDLASFSATLDCSMRLAKCQRSDHRPLLEKIVRLLVELSEESAIEQALSASNTLAQRTFFHIAYTKEKSTIAKLLHIGLRSEDNIIRLKSAECIESVCRESDLPVLVRNCLEDHYAPVRKVAVQLAMDRESYFSEQVWKKCLLDNNAFIRDYVQFKLNARGCSWVDDFYRVQVAVDNPSVPAILGLGETGSKNDCNSLQPLLNHPYPTRRQAAIRSMAKLSDDSFLLSLFSKLSDDSPRVTREALRHLMHVQHLVDEDRLVDLIQRESRTHIRVAGVLLISSFSKWRSLPLLIELLVVEDKATLDAVWSSIDRWYRCNSVFTRPSTSEKNKYLTAFQKITKSLTPDQNQILSKLIETM